MQNNLNSADSKSTKSKMRGDSLLEIMLAIWLIAIAALGAVNLQLWVARSQKSVIWHEHAVQLIDAAAEALRGAYPVNRVQTEWSKLAAAVLPAGGLRIVDRNAEVRLLKLHWNEPEPVQWPQKPRRLALKHWGEQNGDGENEDCPQIGASGVRRCLSIAVAAVAK